MSNTTASDSLESGATIVTALFKFVFFLIEGFRHYGSHYLISNVK
jgi:hypothetical protein